MQGVVTDKTAPHAKDITHHLVYIDKLMGKRDLEFVRLEIGAGNKVGETGGNVSHESRKQSHHQKLNHFAVCLVGASGVEGK